MEGSDTNAPDGRRVDGELIGNDPVDRVHPYAVVVDGEVVYRTPVRAKRERWLRRNARNYDGPRRARVLSDGRWVTFVEDGA